MVHSSDRSSERSVETFCAGREFYVGRPSWAQGGTYTLHDWNGVAPEPPMLSGVWMIARKGDEILLVRHRHRGWEVPGGHLDPGESWDQCLARELREEGSATVLRARPFALGRCRINGAKPEGYKYSYPDSYMMFCEVEIDQLLPFGGEMETEDRALVSKDEALVILRKKDVWNKDAIVSPSSALILRLEWGT